MRRHEGVGVAVMDMKKPATGSPGTGLGCCDAVNVPVICPTRQMVSLVSHTPATGLLLCMGLFSIFWLPAEGTAQGRLCPP